MKILTNYSWLRTFTFLMFVFEQDSKASVEPVKQYCPHHLVSSQIKHKELVGIQRTYGQNCCICLLCHQKVINHFSP